MTISELQLIPGLVGGLLTSLVLFAVIWASYLFAMEIWLSEITEGAQTSEATGKVVFWTTLIIAVLLAGSIATAWWTAARGASFWSSTLSAYWVQVVFNVFDLVVIDIIVYMFIYPKVMQIPGVEPLHAYWPHVRGALMGFVIGVPMALVAGAVSRLA